MGRPKKKISLEQVERLASYGCTASNIADFFGCNQATISRRFGKVLTAAKAEYISKIRMAQLRSALQGNPKMLAFLGERECGQVVIKEAIPVSSQSRFLVVLEGGGNGETKTIESISRAVSGASADSAEGGSVKILPEPGAADSVGGAVENG